MIETKDEVRPLLLVMTVLTGLIDAYSYLVLHVFVANMTGNVLFLAFSLAGAPGFSIFASLLAIGSFLLGALLGGWLGSHVKQQERLLALTATSQMLLLGFSAVLMVLLGTSLPEENAGLIVLLGVAMGLQNATARKLALPDLTTTVLTLTLVGIGADSRLVGGRGSNVRRRLAAVGALFLGAGVGSLLIFQMSVVAPLIVALVLLLLIIGEIQSWSEMVSLPTQDKWKEMVQGVDGAIPGSQKAFSPKSGI
ncbi:MAG TPA: YoaK family protein [Ktedonobacteraceae bacterium]|nr:YoaK family protein [Ktedonobacteraceae bacterium]